MEFQQFYLGCLAHASYLIGDAGEAVIVDPQRDVELYLEEAAKRGLRIHHVIETHVHADFVSGHCELARRTGARIYVGRDAAVDYEHVPVSDGDEIAFGDVVLRFLETPGHTPESVCVLVLDRSGGEPRPVKLLTGDTLFIGDSGRPDLVGALGRTAEEMAGLLYDSLRSKILPLPDEVEIYPGHGAGSACGKNISQARWSTLGEQRGSNPALQDVSREEFVATATSGLAEPPRYFAHDVRMNRAGARGLDELPALRRVDAEALAGLQSGGALVLDVRPNVEFGAGHVPGALNVGLGGSFASWVGKLVDPGRPIALVAASEEQEAEARMRLARIGFEDVVGVLDGGMDAWASAGRAVARTPQIDVAELARRREAGEVAAVLDVRGPGEHEGAHVPGAVSVPLDQLERRLADVPTARPLAVVCASGYRSSAAVSLVAPDGGDDVVNVLGGTNAWVEAGFPTDVPAGQAQA